MDPSSLVVITVAVVAVLAAVGALAVGYRRSVGSEGKGPEPQSHRAKPAPLGDEPAGTGLGPEPIPPNGEEPAPSKVMVVEAQRIVEVSPEEGGVTRRQFFNRALVASFGAYATILGLGTLALFWPRLTGGFGTKVDAGPVEDITAGLVGADGSFAPFVDTEARAYVVPITDEELKDPSSINRAWLLRV